MAIFDNSKESNPSVTQKARCECTTRLVFNVYAMLLRESGCVVRYSSCLCADISRAFGCLAEKVRRCHSRFPSPETCDVDLGFCPSPKEAADSSITYIQTVGQIHRVQVDAYYCCFLLTWALAPPIPKLLTATLSSLSVGHGVALSGTLSFASSQGTGVVSTLLSPG